MCCSDAIIGSGSSGTLIHAAAAFAPVGSNTACAGKFNFRLSCMKGRRVSLIRIDRRNGIVKGGFRPKVRGPMLVLFSSVGPILGGPIAMIVKFGGCSGMDSVSTCPPCGSFVFIGGHSRRMRLSNCGPADMTSRDLHNANDSLDRSSGNVPVCCVTRSGVPFTVGVDGDRFE